MKIIANAIDVSSVPEEIKILPLGEVHSQKGDFLVDELSCKMILERFKERKLDMVIDYEHQTLEDVQAPASGWIKDLYVSDDAIVARVEWTARAYEYLKNKEYRYLSPVVYVRPSDRRIGYISSVALTNTPAIDGMFAIVNSMDKHNDTDDDITIDLKPLLKLLGLPEGSDMTNVMETIQKLLKIQSSTSAELETMKENFFEKEVDEAVQYALKTGKISAAMYEDAKTFARRDLQFFKTYIETAPAAVPMGKFALKSSSQNSTPVTTSSKINQLLGITDEDVIKYHGYQ